MKEKVKESKEKGENRRKQREKGIRVCLKTQVVFTVKEINDLSLNLQSRRVVAVIRFSLDQF